jgi:23S rRNA (cytosine1962-C5)-methyltransferase
MKRIILKHGEESRILGGHPWVYNNEVKAVLEGHGEAAKKAELCAGECADVESDSKHYLGRAFVNPASKIIARIYSSSKEGADSGFFKRRIREAISRRSMQLNECSCRIVFGEADFIPGLILDSYAGWDLDAALEAAGNSSGITYNALAGRLGPPEHYIAAQFLCAGTEARRGIIIKAVNEAVESCFGKAPAALIEKSAVSVRELEALPPSEGIIEGSFPQNGIVIFENGYPFAVNLFEGQKTGCFLDQRQNHAAAAAFANGRRVLDCFCYSGGFAVHAARAGAAEVTAVDSSASALKLLEQNAVLNGVQSIVKPVCSDVFDVLNSYGRSKERFGLIILDPPAFAKSKIHLSAAAAAYEEINLKAISMLETGGILVSCSCSYAITEAHFKHIIARAASRAGKRIVQTDFRGQASCHPILAGYDESCYLKCGIYTVVKSK